MFNPNTLQLPSRGISEHILSLSGKVALVTGGGSGIGREAARCFASAGALVAILDIQKEASQETKALIEREGTSAKVETYRVDVTDRAACNAVVERCAHDSGRIDILFNCAGISRRDAQMDEAQRQQLWSVNVHGTQQMAEAVIPFMQQGKFGRIINVGSVVGYPHISFPLGILYKESKEWVHQYTKTLALEVATSGITVNAVAPGRVMTDLVLKPGTGWVALAPNPTEAFRNGCATQRSGRMLLPSEVAVWALFLCSRYSQLVNGTIIDLSDCWGSAGHEAWTIDAMPPLFRAFRAYAQTTTSTVITEHPQ